MKIENLKEIPYAKEMLEIWESIDNNKIKKYCKENNINGEDFFKNAAKEAYNRWDWNCMCDATFMGWCPSTFLEEVVEDFTRVIKIINLTPHDVNIVRGDGSKVKTFESQGVTRVSTTSKLKTRFNGVNIYTTEYGQVENLPEESDDTYYIVSMLVKQACPNRKDLLSPSQLVRDTEGKIIGCLGLE